MAFTYKFTRRNFLVGCSAAIAALAGSRITNMAFSIGEDYPETIVVLFLRGGWDALNVVPPVVAGTDRGFYEASRPTLKLATSGTNATYNLDGFFGLHPSMGPLVNLFQAQRLAVVHAAGLTYDTRSHFDAMQYMETATLGSKNGTGWLTRYLETLTFPAGAVLPALSSGSSRAASLVGYPEAVAMSSPGSFNVGGNAQYRGQQTNALRNMYGSNADWLDQAGKETVDAIDLIQSKNIGAYTPTNGATYPQGGFGDNLKLIAQMIKTGVGLNAATIDLGGWDTHENQGAAAQGSYMGTLLNTLSRGIEAFHVDLEPCAGQTDFNAKTTLVVMSEFGRRLKENANFGTDHGHGNVMFVVGKTVKGGKVYGQWPGLANDQLYQRADLAITTDYRRVLSEILRVRTARSDAQLISIFPGYTQQPGLDIMYPAGTTPAGNCLAPAPTPTPQPGPAPAPGSKRIYIPMIQKP